MLRVLVILILAFNNLTAQVVDDFSDGDFTNNPEWIGTTNQFRVEQSSGMLRLMAPAVDGTAWLFTRSCAMENAVWQFRARMAFNPSSANYARVYLATESADYPETGAMLYLIIGSAADNISLWESRGGVTRRLIEGMAGRLNLANVDARVRVSRTRGGLLILWSNTTGAWIEEGRFHGSVGMESTWFGFSCHYTSTRASLFFFDDFNVTGEQFRDTIPPSISGLEVLNRYSFRISFSKPASQLQLAPGNFKVEAGDLLPEVIPLPGVTNSVELLFKNGIPVLPVGLLRVTGLTDTSGNLLPDTILPYSYSRAELTIVEATSARSLRVCFSHPLAGHIFSPGNFTWVSSGPIVTNFFDTGQNCTSIELGTDFPVKETLYFTLNNIVAINGDTIDAGPYPVFYHETSRNDIVITEVMADPTPVVSLPASEYIEIFNRGDFPIQLGGYKLSVGTRAVTLGAYLLFPGDYLLLVPSTTAAAWAFVSNKLPLANWPALPATGVDIVLRDKSDRVITSLRYDAVAGTGNFKQEGGWSIEIKDPDNLSGDKGNWTFAMNENGGTPGHENSVAARFKDVKPPRLTGVHAKNQTCIVLEFSEPMCFEDKTGTSRFEIEPSTISVLTFKPEEIYSAAAEICFSRNMPDGKVFGLNIVSLPTDLAGNPLSGFSSTSFGWPVKGSAGDIVINELLFDPPAGGCDYVELYNRSDLIIDLSEMYLARANVDGSPEKLVRLSGEKRFFLPGDYLVFATHGNWITTSFPVKDERLVRTIPDLPNYLTPSGKVFLTDVTGQVIDFFDYHENMHFPLLARTKGVALERVDINAITPDRANWHSASATSGYGTPGMVNSQAVKSGILPQPGFIILEPEVFYPNQDGFNDLLFIRYSFTEAGNSCTVTIFNNQGRPVRHLVNNQLTSTEGFFTWDGLDDKGNRCPSGIYIVWARSFTVNGKVLESRQITVLGAGQP